MNITSKNINRIKTTRVKLLLEAALKKNIKIRQISDKPRFYELKKGPQVTFIQESMPAKKLGTAYLPLNKALSSRITRNKGLTNQILSERKFKVPRSEFISSFNDVKKELRAKRLSYPLVIKDNEGTCGEGLFANIRNDKECKRAISNIKAEKGKGKNLRIIAEDFYPGRDFRILVLDREVIAILERILPVVTGDGKRSIQNLITEYISKQNNKLFLGKEIKRNIAFAGYKLNDILPAKEDLILRYNANVSTGALSRTVSAKNLSPYLKRIARQVISTFKFRYGGIDLLTKKPAAKKPDYRIIEVNSNADHSIHMEPTKGRPINVSSKIIKAIFKNL